MNVEQRIPVVPSVVRLDRVSVKYGRSFALRDVSAEFPSGAVGLLGPNGAGKSTMIKALLGFVVPDEGQMRVLDLDVRHSPRQIRARIGYMPESDAHIPGMNAVSFVAYCAELCGLPRADAMQRAHEVLYYVGLGQGTVATQGPIAGLKEHGGRVFELRIKGDSRAFVEVLRAAGLECHET